MPQRYKLRLGDGTVVSVDQDGLRTWAGDGRAMAQAVGTQQWRPLQDVLAEEEAAARLARALVPPKPRQEAATARHLRHRRPSTPPLELPGIRPGRRASHLRRAASRPSLQVLADDPASWRAADPPAEVAIDDMPVIPMKPLDDEPEFRSALAEREEEEEDEYVEDEPRQDRLDGPLLTVLETGGGFLSRSLNRLTPLADRLTAEGPTIPVRTPTPSGTPAQGGGAPLAAARVRRSRKTLRPARRGGRLGLGGRTVRRSSRESPAGCAGSALVCVVRSARSRLSRSARSPPAWTPPPAPVARKPVAAPVPVSELPALRFVESREPPAREDVYGGDEPGRSWNLRPLWDWTKRLVTTGALVAALVYAILERDVWFPRTAELGQTVFTQIDRQVLSRKRNEEQRQALAAASEQLPELAPETIQLIFSRSPAGVVEAGEVFQIAREAADRGMGALAPAEAEELRALARELLGDAQPHRGGARSGVRPHALAPRDLPVRESPRDGARRPRCAGAAAGTPRAAAGAHAARPSPRGSTCPQPRTRRAPPAETRRAVRDRRAVSRREAPERDRAGWRGERARSPRPPPPTAARARRRRA